MKTTIRTAAQIGFVSAIALCATVASAQVVAYDNTTSSLDLFHGEPNGTWFGDEITLAAAGNITAFSFETVASSDIADGTVNLRIYDQLGAGGSPGAVLYESGAFAISYSAGSNGRQTHEITGLDIDVSGSSSITWAVSFSTSAGSGNLALYDSPSVGSSFNDFWTSADGTTWITETFPGGTPVANFGAQVIVPEPTTIALGVIGGLALVGAYRRRRA